MIPKIIHYCWFGNGEKDELTKKCIESWRKQCPDYEIIEWNESNYDVTKNTYMLQAYKEKRWGFVPDYARVDIIYNHGGIYLDTDVELIKPLDSLLPNKAFFGFENSKEIKNIKINLGQGFASEKGNPLIKMIRDDYETILFRNEDNTLNLTPSPIINSKLFVEYGFIMNNHLQTISGNVLYPYEYFSPYNWENKKGKITNNTYSIHHYNGSWVSKKEKKKRKRERRIDYLKHLPNRVIKTIIGEKRYECLKSKLRGRSVN